MCDCSSKRPPPSTACWSHRARRARLESRPDIIWDILNDGTAKAKEVTARTLEEVREAMKINYFQAR